MPVLFTPRFPGKPINELYAYNFVTNYKPHRANHNAFRRSSYSSIIRTYHVATMMVNDFIRIRT